MTRQQIKQTLKFHAVTANFKGLNLWNVISGNTSYEIEVFFAGYGDKFSHGYQLVADCKCDAARFGKNCIHADKVLAQYENDNSLLFPLFGMEVPAPVRFAPLWAKARETADRLQANSFKAVA